MDGERNNFQDRGNAQYPPVQLTTETPATVEEINNSASVHENINNMTSKSKENDKNSTENVEGSQDFTKQEDDSEADFQTKTHLEKCMQSTNEMVKMYRSFATVSEIDKIKETLDETEKWFYACIEKMIALEAILKPIEDRISVDKERSPAICELLYFIFDCRVSVISSNEDWKGAIHKECESVEQWLVCKMEEQNSLPKNVDPVLHPDEIRQRMHDLNKRIVEINLRYYMSEIQHKLQSRRYDSFVSDGEVAMIFYKIGSVSTVLNDNRNLKSEDFLHSSLIELKQCFGPIENRFRDAEDSRIAFDKLSNRISHYRDSASKLSDGQISSMIINKCNEVQKWIGDVHPFARSSEVNKMVEDMEMICEYLLKQVKQSANTTNRSNHGENQHNQTRYENRESKENQNQYSHGQMGGDSMPRDQRAMGMQTNDHYQPSSDLTSHTFNDSNPKVYFDINIGQKVAGRLVIRLFMDVVPKTAKNFLSLCTGEKKYESYAGTLIHLVFPGQLCQGGVYTKTQQEMYGILPSFPQENFVKKHTRRGMLSMSTDVRAPQLSHGTGFIICFKAAPGLDNRYVVFGEIIDGIEVLDQIEAVGGTNGTTKKKVVIVHCDRLN